MAINHFNLLWQEIAELKRQMSSQRPGYVSDVQGDRIRAVIGFDPDGQPLKTPWISTENHRGGSRERIAYAVGQSICMNQTIPGTWNGATVTPWAESKSFPAPGHANQINGESRQVGKLRESHNKPQQQQSGGQGGGQGEKFGDGSSGGGGQQGGDAHFHDVWIADQDEEGEPHQQQSSSPDQQGGGFSSIGSSGSGLTSQTQQGGQQGGQAKPTMKSRVHEKTGITHRYGKNVRLFASEKEAIIAYGESMQNTIFCNESGCYSTKPIQIKKPQSKPDND